MSTIDATFYLCERAQASERLFPMDFEPLRDAAGGFATRLFARLENRQTIQRITRFSDHRLHDIGFERDLDGSVVPTRR